MKRLVLLTVLFGLTVAPGFAQTANRMVGPIFPILIDTDGNGAPTEDIDQGIVPTFDGVSLGQIVDPLDPCTTCGSGRFIQLSDPVGGQFTTITRYVGLERQSISVGAMSGGRPTSFRMEVENGIGIRNGTGQVLDFDSNGRFDALRGTSTSLNFTMNFVQSDVDGDGVGDYISIPWSQAGLAGVEQGYPQIWIPIADTTGDGLPDSIVLDLNGDGAADPQFLVSPPVGPAPAVGGLPATPTLSGWGVMAMMVGLLGAALTVLRRNAFSL